VCRTSALEAGGLVAPHLQLCQSYELGVGIAIAQVPLKCLMLYLTVTAAACERVGVLWRVCVICLCELIVHVPQACWPSCLVPAAVLVSHLHPHVAIATLQSTLALRAHRHAAHSDGGCGVGVHCATGAPL
jgi:hypothetical protein